MVFLFPVLQVFGIPNSQCSLDLDDRQGFIASSAMQQKKKKKSSVVSPICPQAPSRVDWLALKDDDITKKFPILLEGILQVFFCSMLLG